MLPHALYTKYLTGVVHSFAPGALELQPVCPQGATGTGPPVLTSTSAQAGHHRPGSSGASQRGHRSPGAGRFRSCLRRTQGIRREREVRVELPSKPDHLSYGPPSGAPAHPSPHPSRLHTDHVLNGGPGTACTMFSQQASQTAQSLILSHSETGPINFTFYMIPHLA